MTQLQIPSKDRREWRGIFPSKYRGDIQASWNIDLERMPGIAALSGAMVRTYPADSDTATGFLSDKFIKANVDGTSRIWAFANTGVARTVGSTVTLWTPDTYANSPLSGINDAILHGDTDLSDSSDSKNRILVALNSTIIAFNTISSPEAWDTDWFSGDTNGPLDTTFNTSGAGGSGQPHIFAKVQSLVTVTDGDAYHTIDKNDVVTRRRIAFPVGYEATCAYTSTTRFWHGLQNKGGGDGLIISWDGSSESYTDYPFVGTPVSGWVNNGVPYFINNFGQIFVFKGWGFEEVRHFPFYEEGIQISVGSGNNDGIHRNGCMVEGDVVKIMVGAPRLSQRTRSGIWIYNTKTNNLYHSQSLSYFGDTTRSDFGNGYLFRPGPIFNTRDDATDATLVVSGSVYSSDTTHSFLAISRPNNSLSSRIMRGYIVTGRIPASEVQDVFQKLWARFRKFSDSNSKIVVKFRVVEPLQTSSSTVGASVVQQNDFVHWLSDTSFRADASFSVPPGVKIGHEVEIMAGQNAGCVFHITAITDTNGTALSDSQITDTTSAIVSIDEDAPSGDSYGSYVRYDNWTKVEAFSDTGIAFHDFTIPGSDSNGNIINAGSFVEFKVELRGRIMELEALLPVLKESVIVE